MTDFTMTFGDFDETTILVIANTQKAREYIGYGLPAVSCEIYKSAGPTFTSKIESMGFTYEVAA